MMPAGVTAPETVAPIQHRSIPAAAGIGLRFVHHAIVLETKPHVAWLEVHTENYMGGGKAPAYLDAIRCDYPISLHGVGLSLGSVDGLDEAHLERVALAVARFEPGLVSEHLSWNVVNGTYLADLLPLPLTEEALDIVCQNVDQLQSRLRRQILVENPSSYLRFKHSCIPEWQFLAAVAARTGCGILCDVNNIYVSAGNHGWDALAYADALPRDAVAEIHVAGHAERDLGSGRVLRIDDHGSRVSREVWSLYMAALDRFGPVPTLVEWDTDVPAFEVLQHEAAQAQIYMDTFRALTPSLREVQRAMRDSLVAADERAAASYVVADGLTPEQRIAVYRNTFDSTAANALRLSYPAIYKLVGGEFFEGAARVFAHSHPPRASCLDLYGEDFADFLATFAPAASLPYLADVARLEWAVNRAMHAPDSEPLDPNQIAAVDPELHEHIRFVFDPSISLLRVDHAVDAIWRAVLASDDAALAAVDLGEPPVHLLIQRLVTGVEVIRVDETAFRMTSALIAGLPLGAAVASTDAATAAAVLADHLSKNRWVGFELAQEPVESCASESAA